MSRRSAEVAPAQRLVRLGLAETLPAAASARTKLERVFPFRLKQRLAAVNDSVALELARPVAAVDQQVLALLCTATQEQRRVDLDYLSRGEQRTRRPFDPYGLAYREGRWYSVGWCHLRRGLRSFRLDRVRATNVLSEKFERPKGFDALNHLRESIAMIPRAHGVEVLLHTDLATAQRHVAWSFGMLEWTNEGVLLRAQAEELAWVARELARLPFDFTVRAPRALRTELTRVARQLMRLAAKSA